jgi:hypothetical protein
MERTFEYLCSQAKKESKNVIFSFAFLKKRRERKREREREIRFY